MFLKNHPRPIKILQCHRKNQFHVNIMWENIKYDNLAELLIYNLEAIIYLLRLTSCELIKNNEEDEDCSDTTISGIVEKM